MPDTSCKNSAKGIQQLLDLFVKKHFDFYFDYQQADEISSTPAESRKY